MEAIIRIFSILTSAVYIFYKLLNYNLSETRILLRSIFVSIPISLTSFLFFSENQSINWTFLLLMFFAIMSLINKTPITVIYSTSLFSFAFSFIIYSLSGIISSLLFALIYYGNYNLPWLLIHVTVCFIHFTITYSIFCIPRLQKGMNFIYHIPSGNIGSSICLFIIMAVLMLSQVYDTIGTWTLKTILFTLFFFFLLVYWWNYHLTQTYRKYLKKNEINSLNNLVLEKDTEIQRLKEEHDRLAHLIHKDNKLLPAFILAITDFLENKNNLPSDELKNYGNSLKNQLELLYDERMKSVVENPQSFLSLPLTNLSSVDAVLSFMHKRTLKENTQFQLILSDDISTLTSNIIAEKDLTLILSELLENALYASKSIPNANIQTHLGIYDEMFTIRVSNTGKSFEIDTLQNLGITKHTSHQATGGSGTGMMDIWMLKEQYHATLIIDEHNTASETSVQTSISILFNGKNHYIIHSDRYKDLIKSINRPDILILSKE